MPEVDDKVENQVETEQASAGEAKRVDPRAARARATARDQMLQEELDIRQKGVGLKRRSGGPPLDEAPEGKAHEVAEAECLEPPDER